MIITGAKCISKLLKATDALQEFYMGCNKINDSGVAVIPEALSSNRTVRVLELRDNDITVEGVLLVLNSAVDNTVCQLMMNFIRMMRLRRC